MRKKLIISGLMIILSIGLMAVGKRPQPIATATVTMKQKVKQSAVKAAKIGSAAPTGSNIGKNGTPEPSAPAAVERKKLTPAEQLLAKTQDNINFFNADFNLVVKELDSDKIYLKASGQVWLANNRRYRVQYVLPQKQLLVSNGIKRWLYLEKINQVQIQSMPPQKGGNPTEFFLELGGGLSRLLNTCHAEMEKKENQTIYTLIPMDKTKAQFVKAIIWTKGLNKVPVKLRVIADRLITVDFSQLHVKVKDEKMTEKEKALFNFIKPQDAEVIEMFWPMQ